ncbi:MAG: aminotransferase class IV [Chthoniobacteraceae bacterium]
MKHHILRMRNHPDSPLDFGDTKTWTWAEDCFEPCEHVPLSDRGFRYGMSVFESVRISNGEPEFWDRHLARLRGACAEREFAVADRALEAAGQLLECEKSVAWARVYVTAGDGQPTAAVEAPRVFVIIEGRAPATDESYEITICEEEYRAPFRGLKTANYWFNIEARAGARKLGFDEALLFNGFAELVSASMANVFVVRENEILTPHRSSGARTGVIREWVMGRRKVQERRLRREDVVQADEIFLTSSWLGVMPVATVEGRPLGHRVIGPKLAAELENRR